MSIKKTTIVIAILGLLDAIYLTIIKFTNNKALCLEGVGDCWSVNNSPYSEWNGIPISIFGGLAYILILLILWNQNKFEILRNYGDILVTGISLSGFILSIYLTYLQFAVIKAVCPFCILSALTMTTVFILSMVNYFKNQDEIVQD
jgi:uncharacterized membrane protein